MKLPPLLQKVFLLSLCIVFSNAGMLAATSSFFSESHSIEELLLHGIARPFASIGFGLFASVMALAVYFYHFELSLEVLRAFSLFAVMWLGFLSALRLLRKKEPTPKEYVLSSILVMLMVVCASLFANEALRLNVAID